MIPIVEANHPQIIESEAYHQFSPVFGGDVFCNQKTERATLKFFKQLSLILSTYFSITFSFLNSFSFVIHSLSTSYGNRYFNVATLTI